MAHKMLQAYDLIKAAHERGRMAHAYLISGAPNTGKEELAARLIQLVAGSGDVGSGSDLFGEEPEVVEEVPSLNDQESSWIRVLRPQMKSRRIGVEEIRDLEQSLHLVAPGSSYKVGVIVEADRMNEQAANAFLKTLEEPPQRTLLLLLTANPQRLLPTILSRCVLVPLLGGSKLLDQGGKELVMLLNQTAKRGFGTPTAAMQLKAVFSAFLTRSKSEADAASKMAQKEEANAYKNGTDGVWLKQREVFYKAAAESEYLHSRNQYLDVLMAWMADLLRMKVGSGGLDFPESAELLASVAEAETESGLLQRVEALDEMRRTLETNAFEPLAIEVGFLKAFG